MRGNLERKETRKIKSMTIHTRLDYPEQNDAYGLFNIFLQKGTDENPVFEKKPVALKYMAPPGLK